MSCKIEFILSDKWTTNPVCIIVVCYADVSEQRVYYDFPRTTDGTLWGSRVIMFGW